jgi:hypothetical protein
MINLRTLWMAGLLLIVAGCGCGSDQVPTATTPGGNFTLRARLTVAPGRRAPMVNPAQADVLFLLDDSWNMEIGTTRAKGTNAFIANDGTPAPGTRRKGDVAKQIVQQVQNLLKTSLANRFPDRPVDLAFGVARFEDYGGGFRNPPVEDVVGTPANEAQASLQSRPFILNQPILRELHPDFAGRFNQALDRVAPGDGRERGSPELAVDAGSKTDDAQSAFEALFQAASGVGFDGNGNGNTGDSGVAGNVATQTTPGTSGDVPAPTYTPTGADPQDPRWSVYQVGETIASGNEGGAGWRPDSIRLIVVVSDICAVAPFDAGFVGNPYDAVKTVTSTASAPGAGPRLADAVPNPGLACFAGLFDEAQRRTDRFGRLPAPVAPGNAATVQMAITALNQMDIEVLGIGTPPGLGVNPGQTKPGDGDTGVVFGDANGPQADAALFAGASSGDPFKWLTAVARLSGARDPDSTNVLFTPPNIPLVYDLGGNKATSLLPPTGGFRQVIVEDMTDRIGEWLDFQPPPGPTNVCASIRWMFDVQQPDPSTGMTLANLSFPSTSVSVPLYEDGTTPPPPVFVEGTAQFVRIDPNSSNEQMATLNFVATPIFEYANPVGSVNPADVLPKPVSGRLTVVLPAATGNTAPLGEFVLQPGSQGCFVLSNVDNPSNTFTSSDCGTVDPSTAQPASGSCAQPAPTLLSVHALQGGQIVSGVPANTDPAMLESDGYAVALSGTNFTDGSIVTIDGKEVPAADVVSISPTQIVVIPPRVDVVAPATSMTVDVSVTTQFGTVALPQSLTYGTELTTLKPN